MVYTEREGLGRAIRPNYGDVVDTEGERDMMRRAAASTHKMADGTRSGGVHYIGGDEVEMWRQEEGYPTGSA
jgi:hypothetical protein